MAIMLEQLSLEHAEALYAFEKDNRAFFETMIPGRGEDYFVYENFLSVLHSLLDEQERGLSYFHVIIDEFSNLVGRMNIVDIDTAKKSAHVGYRVGESYLGKGIASNALKAALTKAVSDYGLTELHAKTTGNNIASQNVLTKCGFKLVSTDEEFLYFLWRNNANQ